ncbi:prepilin-type N-terminal cleavage/methylation domain-containing protein [Anoxybacter fermentans]|uniref:prepilin-type N-terminal cleavage/methylation domain-containing protein n=1 Tax=Anoxybacter fermentans TaxID=1323375 RepID=UPI0013DF1436|nr:prepilin-type N-terminal cleavage/methylation domain-containing protein [Anoxybacter fermentans]
MSDTGFTLFELLVVISLMAVLFLIIPGLDGNSLTKIANEDEVQRLVDLLRWAQRRAILHGKRHYLTLDPVNESYRIYELEGDEEKVLKKINLEGLDMIGLNRTVKGMEQTFYYTPQGTPVFGCTITLEDKWTRWNVVIAVGSGKIRIDRE